MLILILIRRERGRAALETIVGVLFKKHGCSILIFTVDFPPAVSRDREDANPVPPPAQPLKMGDVLKAFHVMRITHLKYGRRSWFQRHTGKARQPSKINRPIYNQAR